MRPLPIPTLNEADKERFWGKVRRLGPDECWPWLGARATTKWAAYGCFRLGDRKVYPHRVAYTLLVGPIPDELTLDHIAGKCFLGSLCCNPFHAEPVTQLVNHQRHHATFAASGEGRRIHTLKKRHIMSKPEECRRLHPGIPLSKYCPACQRLMAKYRAAEDQERKRA